MAHSVAVSDEAHKALKDHADTDGLKLGRLLDSIIRRYFELDVYAGASLVLSPGRTKKSMLSHSAAKFLASKPDRRTT
jgi:hypothetical protein